MAFQTVPNYDFKKDFSIAIETENEVSRNLLSFYGLRTTETCDDNRYDLKVINPAGNVFTVEVKEDFTCERTGNVGVEFKCRGKPSGISVSKADVYIYKLHTKLGIQFYMINTSKIKDMVGKHLYKKIVMGGDPNSGSMNYIFDLRVFAKNARRIFQ